MSTPTGDNAFLHALELNVRTELAQAETGQPQEEAVGGPIEEWLSDPADAPRYEASLRSLLGAVEALEDASGPATILRRPKRQRAGRSKQKGSPMDTMMALRAHARSGPEQLVYEQAPAPAAGLGEALIAVHAAAIYLRGADLGLVVDHP